MEARCVPQEWVLDEDPWDQKEDKAAWRNVVEGSDRVQLNPLGSQQDLDHYQSRGFEGDGSELEEDAPGVELGLSVSGDGDIEGDGEHVEHGVALEGLFLEEDADGVDGDGHEGLEHLDEGNGEEDVGGVGGPEGERVEGADGDDRGEVKLPGHGDGIDELENLDDGGGEGGVEGHVDQSE
ncbi:hypothetical protein SAY87_023255 [Trapa incisa]|uniref:Uncharacterized protein n=1 Tax=Trapa incisa TaxID=236973 RepID=A0AAN7K7V6_9MYRT|nr:hypothetical protein SAY87_023255 [Trapa incisa]